MKKITKEELAEWINFNQMNMYRLALSIVKNETDAEDVVCEAVVKAFEHINSLKDPEKLKAWIMSIVCNTAKSMCRKKRHEVIVAEVPDSDYQIDEYENVVWEYIFKLSEAQRSAFVLHFYSGYNIKEISEILKIREGTVKSRLGRARESLREMLREGEYG